MPPVKMTRQQYEAQYGVKPVSVSTEDFDTTPAPIRMTRAEYNATYRPQAVSYKADVKRDFASMGQNVDTALQEGATLRQEATDRVVAGETTPKTGVFQILGGGLATGANVIAQSAMGLARTVLPQSVETRLSETIGKDLEKLFSPETRAAYIEKLKESEGGLLVGPALDQKAGAFLEDIGNSYRNDANFRANVRAVGGILEWLTLPGTARTAVVKSAETASDVAGIVTPPLTTLAKDIKDGVNFTASPEARVRNQANDILKVESKYSNLRKANEAAGAKADESRLRIAQSNVLEGAVDDTGRINTAEAVKAYKAQTIDGAEDVVRKELEKEGGKINLKELEYNLKANILDSGLEGGALYTALKGVEKQLKGLSVRADAFGDVPLYKLQDAKISEYNTIDYSKKTSAIYKKTLARTYKEAIEAKSSLPVKEINTELSKFYGDIDRLVKLDGRVVEGGKLGKYGAQVVGTGVGMAGGSVLGGGGAALGGMLGGEIAQRLKGRSMASTFNRGIDGSVPESPILTQAKKGFETDLRTPSAKVGVPSNIIKTPEMVKVESQIAKNIDLQKKAIKEGNFTLVAELKTIYQSLVDRLKALIEDYRKNGPPIGMSIRKTVTPESVAKKIDDEDFNRLVDVIEDVTLAKTDPDTKRMLADMGLSRATDDELVRFAKDTTDEYGIQRNQALMSDQNQATNPPTTAQSISDTVQDTVDNVNTPQTTALLEEAKKYKSAEEKVRAIKQANLKTPEELIMAIEDLFPSKVAGKAEAYEQNVSVFFDMAPSKLAKQFQKELDSIESSAEWADRFSEVKLSARDYYNSVVSKAIVNNTKNITSGFVYHGTNPRNLENIKKEGLKTGNYGNLYFAPTEEGIAGYGGGTPIKLRVKREFLGDYVEGGVEQGASRLGEIKTKTNIPPERLEIFKDGEWKPLISN